MSKQVENVFKVEKRVPQPGTMFGPCEEECAHIECWELRNEAEQTCVVCGEPIGFDRFYTITYQEPVSRARAKYEHSSHQRKTLKKG